MGLQRIILMVLLPSVSLAFDTTNIPFIGKKTAFNIIVEDDPSLRKRLDKELKFQRKNNYELQQYTKRRRIARLEAHLLTERLRAEGYYDASVAFTLSDKEIVYTADPGQPYRIKNVSLTLPDGVHVPEDILRLRPGDRLKAKKILAANKTLRTYLADSFCLYRIDTDYDVILESSTHSAHVTFIVNDSPLVRFGDIRLTGLESVDEAYLKSKLTIARGECFKRKQIEKDRLNLIHTNLLASVTTRIGKPIDNEVSVTLQAVERHHRSLSAGGGYQTDEGLGILFGWEHRNLMGRAQRLKIDAQIAENRQNLSGELTIPHFYREDQSITFYTDATGEDTEAFESQTVNIGADISRQLSKYLRAIVGSGLSFSNVQENDTEDDFALASIPISLEYDRRNNPLDPLRGWAGAVNITPFRDLYEADTRFVKSTLATSAYFTFEDALWRPTLAVRGAVGMIDGVDRDDVPANLRFYVGGGGSVRGYPFQTLGPLDGEDDKPLGGLSFTEMSFETRVRWGDDWGGVVFLDGGRAYEDSSPQLGKRLFWGAGLGVRYFTGFAPLRIDLAVPLDKRDGVDDDFQLYISIGQAF